MGFIYNLLMGAVYKFLEVFNSAQKPWQVTLAIVLGMFSGFMPLSGIQTFIILLIALVINVPFAIYLFFAAQFALIGYLLDPTFESIGYALLHIDALNGMWTMFYNNGLMRLSNFDNTIVLGSMAFSLILALPVYVIVKKVLIVYREKLANFFARFSFLQKLKLFQMSDKPVKTFRIWGLGLFIGILALLGAFLFIFMDSLFKKGIESGLSALLDKEVTIRSLEVDLDNAALNIAGLDIQDPSKNRSLVYIGEISADIDFNALLMSKTHVEHINIKGMTFDQALKAKPEPKSDVSAPTTTSSAATPPKTTSKTPTPTVSSSSSSSNTASSAPAPAPAAMNLPNIDEVIKSEDLKSAKLAETAKVEYNQITTKWDGIMNTEFGPDFRQSFQKDLNAIKAQAKDVRKLADTKKKVDAFTAKVNTAKARITTLKREFQADKALLQKRIDEIQKAKDEDFKALKSKYSLDKGGVINIIGAIFGDNVKSYLNTANEYYEKIEPLLSSDDEAEPTPHERHNGRRVKFKEERPSPALLIKKVDMDGTLRSQKFSGLITDITNDQKSLKKTTKLIVKSDGKEIRKMLILGELDTMGKHSVASLDYKAQEVDNMVLDLSFITLQKSDMSFSGTTKIIDGAIQSKTHLGFTKSDLRVKGMEGKLGDAIRKDLKKTKDFTVDIGAQGRLAAPSLSVHSSLETIVSNSIKRMMQAEIDQFEKQLNQKLSKMVGKDLGAMDMSKMVGIDKALGAEDGALNSVQKDASNAAKQATPKVNTNALKKRFGF